MSTYRAFRLTLAGENLPADWLVAVSDAEAHSQAMLLCDDATRSVVIWQGARLVGTYHC